MSTRLSIDSCVCSPHLSRNLASLDWEHHTPALVRIALTRCQTLPHDACTPPSFCHRLPNPLGPLAPAFSPSSQTCSLSVIPSSRPSHHSAAPHSFDRLSLEPLEERNFRVPPWPLPSWCSSNTQSHPSHTYTLASTIPSKCVEPCFQLPRVHLRRMSAAAPRNWH